MKNQHISQISRTQNSLYTNQSTTTNNSIPPLLGGAVASLGNSSAARPQPIVNSVYNEMAILKKMFRKVYEIIDEFFFILNKKNQESPETQLALKELIELNNPIKTLEIKINTIINSNSPEKIHEELPQLNENLLKLQNQVEEIYKKLSYLANPAAPPLSLLWLISKDGR